MDFVKMHGCGNDFIVTDGRAGQSDKSLIAAVPLLCDRRKGVGADGVIVLQSSVKHDFRMRIFNADGSEAEMCGNGIRCLARFVAAKGISDLTTLVFETGAGPITTRFEKQLVTVDMGAPILAAHKIPTLSHESRLIAHTLSLGERTVTLTAVSMGNPHAVIFVDELSDQRVLVEAEHIKAHPFFPRSVNVEYVKVLSDSRTRLRVNERGVGETLACGTGTCASVVAGILEKRHGNSVTVELAGGELHVQWSGDPNQSVFLTGPAVTVFEGRTNLGGDMASKADWS